MKTRLLVAIVSVLVLAALALPVPVLDARAGLFDSPPPGGPENDHFDNAFVIGELPFTHYVDLSAATLEMDEPTPSCALGYAWSRSVWYIYSPAQSGSVTVWADAWSSAVAAYTGDSLPGLAEVGSQCWGERLTFWAEAGTTYYFHFGDMYDSGGWRTFYVEGPPVNDNFANATAIGGLPFSDSLNNWAASREQDEPTPSCGQYYDWGKTVWYAFAPEESASLWAHLDYSFSPFIAIYTGNSLAELQEVACKWEGDWQPFYAEAEATYYLQVGAMWNDGGWLAFYLEATPPPVADFWFSHDQPSMFDTVWFYNNSWDPVNVGFAWTAWDFGDGTTSTEWSPSHQYAADGDYTIQLTVTTYDGRSASTSRTLSVRTHDVAITKFQVPKAASAGQTRSIVVGVNSRHQPERVQVELFKSVPGGYDWVGTLIQSVPVRPSNRTTDFGFSYTFTPADAQVGKVTFRAVANLVDAWDALPADNEAIAPPTKVNR